MGLFDNGGVLQALEDLLDRERALILKGDIDGVRRLSHEKDRLMTRLATLTFKRGRLQPLRQKADRNNELLAASARGFKAVQDRIAALGRHGETLKTYGSDRNRAALVQRRSDFNRRA